MERMEPQPFWKSLNSLNSLWKKFSEIFSWEVKTTGFFWGLDRGPYTTGTSIPVMPGLGDSVLN